MGTGYVCAQAFENRQYNNDTTYYCVSSSVGYVYHQYGGDESFDSWGVITGFDTSMQLMLTFMNSSGSRRVPVCGYIDIWDGDPGDSLLIHFTDSLVNMRVLSYTGDHVTFHLHYDAYSLDTIFFNKRQFTLRWGPSDPLTPVSPGTSPCSQTIGGITFDSISSTGAVMHYTPANLTLVVTIDGRTYVAHNGRLVLSGLNPNTNYLVTAVPVGQQESPCCRSKKAFYTEPETHHGCPNVLNLRSNYVRCFHNGSIGLRDYGPGNDYSQHTVHTNPNETDRATDNQLHTVGPGLPGAVRLGNVVPGNVSEAGGSESIVYYLHVDTTLYSMIMLHYAVVLQDPGHNPAAQPHFTMQILDQEDEVIDPVCGAADFAADSTLGWNNYDGTLWKDWTTIGISLTPYHGQDVKLKFSTRDCSMGAHYGYAYFYAECQQPAVTSEHCGTVDTNTLTAPNDFTYLWYYDSPSNPVATTQSYTYSSAEGTIHCQLSFIENPSCHLTLSTYVSNFWPSAAIDTFFTVDRGCDGYEVHFANRSTILGDDSIPLPGTPPCESALWVFGDGYISSQYAPTHTYRRPGPYSVTMIAKLAGGECTDTTHFFIVAPDAWAPSDQHLFCCDSLLWLDSLWYSRDTVGPTARVAYPESCDTIYTLHLATLPSSHYTFPDDTFCFNSRYYWRGQVVPVSPSPFDSLFHHLTDTLVAANGCDSVLHLHLLQLSADRLGIKVQADCGLGLYRLTADTDKPFWQWGSTPHDPALDGHETDRELWVFPDSAITYTLTSYYGDSLFCPTTTARELAPPSFPRAELEVTPAALTYERPTLYAFDHSNKYNRRQWAVELHGASDDSIPLPDTLQRIAYLVPISDYDSATVILVVGNEFCYDTASQTLPIVRYALFAPNVFTPDASTNNRFTVVCNGAVEAELTLYNRQGLFVYSTADLEQGWDGTHNGTPCPQGAYVWHFRYRTVDRPTDWNKAIGTVTLLR